MQTLSTLLLALLLVVSSHAFVITKPNKFSTGLSSTPQADEAIQAYSKQFPFSIPEPTNESGLPDEPRRRRGLTDIDEPTARATFDELAKLYGADEAVEMVKAYPQALCFTSSRFEPALDAFSDVFGREKAQAMVRRNPCLLAVSPNDAATSSEQTMFFSYVVAYTRPLGPVLLGLLAAAMSVPVIEGVTGVSKGEIFASLLNAS